MAISGNADIIIDIKRYADTVDSLDDASKIVATREIFDKFIACITDEFRLRSIDEVFDVLTAFLNTEAFDKSFNYTYDKIPHLAMNYYLIYSTYYQPYAKRFGIDNPEEFKRYVVSLIGEYLSRNDVVSRDNLLLVDFNMYDKMLRQYINILWQENQSDLLDNIALDALEVFLINLPEDKRLEETRTFEREILPKNRYIPRLHEMLEMYVPSRNNNYFVESLEEASKDLNTEDKVKRFDELLYLYLVLHNQEAFTKTAYKSYGFLIRNVINGDLRNTKTFKNYIMQRQEQYDVQKVIVDNSISLLKDLLARLYEENVAEISVSNVEFMVIYNNFFGQIGCKMDTTKIEEFLRNFSNSHAIYANDLAKMIVRVHEMYKDTKPVDSNMWLIYQFVKQIDVSKLLSENLEIKKLQSGSAEYLQASLNALILLLEVDFRGAHKIILNHEFESILARSGYNIYSTNVMDKFITLWIDKYDEYGKLGENVIKNYINYQVTQKNFELLKEKGLCDILQACYVDGLMDETSSDVILSTFRQGIARNPRLAKVDLLTVKIEVEIFVETFKNKAVTSLDEEKFREFLRYLSILKMGNDFSLEQKYIDFILNQALRKESIVYRKRNHYGYLIKEALEDLARNDYKRRSECKKCKLLYLVRDYDNHKEKFIIIKNDDIDNFYDGNVEIIERLFSENTKILINNKLNDNFEKSIDNESVAASYISQVIPLNRVFDVTKILRDNLVKEFNEEIDRAIEVATVQEESYNEVEDNVEESTTDTSTLDIVVYNNQENIVDEYPEIDYEYHLDGTRKNIDELLTDAKNDNDSFDIRRMIFYASKVLEKESSLPEAIDTLIYFSSQNDNTVEFNKFLTDITSDNVAYALKTNVLDKILEMNSFDLDMISECCYYHVTREAINMIGKKNPFIAGCFIKSEYYDCPTAMEVLDRIEEEAMNRIPNFVKYCNQYFHGGTIHELEDEEIPLTEVR